MTTLLMVLMGGLGATCRLCVDHVIRQHIKSFPLGTLVINVIGSFLLGLLVGAGPSHDVRTVLGTGFCGAFTTFSTFAFETARLLEELQPRPAALNIGTNLLLCCGVAAAGLALG